MRRNHKLRRGFITSAFGRTRQLTTNPKKSAVVVFSNHSIGDSSRLQVQGKVLPVSHEYTYLGITLSDEQNYLSKHEEKLKMMAKKTLHQMHAQILWGFNKFEMSRAYWKGVAVPKLTYGNAVTTMTAKTAEALEKAQREAARWALNITGWRVANEFLSSELNWSSFEEREAKSKLRYFARIQSMPDSRWPKMMLNAMDLQKIRTKAYEKMEALRSKFDCDTLTVEHDEERGALLGVYYRRLAEKVKTMQDKAWEEGMAGK
ncbi:uncharacterized protein LOC108865252 [Galendromus occidentalis]|uniref:Uncharacterized protein LOC108865252 n=1 Tax=Galendromus occidentalis TaxID=34638 RepID=A0AAJ7L8M2_9ACAR|nr:uncharacterized protein LOC108865252 [Galendromus occidentalis]